MVPLGKVIPNRAVAGRNDLERTIGSLGELSQRGGPVPLQLRRQLFRGRNRLDRVLEGRFN